MSSIESKVAFLHDVLTLLSTLDQLLWNMYRMISTKPSRAVSNPIVDRFGPINLDHFLLASVPRQELIAEQRRDCDSFNPPLSAVVRRCSSPFTSEQCQPRLQL